MKEERRKTPRVPTEHLVSYKVVDERGETDEMGMARTLDLSEGGLVLEMAHPLGEGVQLEIKMVSADQILEARARVVYSKLVASGSWRVGVAFTEITERDLATIAREVEQRRREEVGVDD